MYGLHLFCHCCNLPFGVHAFGLLRVGLIGLWDDTECGLRRPADKKNDDGFRTCCHDRVWYLFISFILWHHGVNDRLGDLLANVSLKVPIKAFGLSMQVLVVQLQLERILLVSGLCRKPPSFQQVLRTICGWDLACMTKW